MKYEVVANKSSNYLKNKITRFSLTLAFAEMWQVAYPLTESKQRKDLQQV